MDNRPRRSRPPRSVRDGDADSRLERARHRHRRRPSQRRRLPRRASRTDARPPRRDRPWPGHRGHHLGVGTFAFAGTCCGYRRSHHRPFHPLVGARDDWDRVSRIDGSADLLRDAAPQPLRLDVVRIGLDADRRRVPVAGAERRAHRWIDDAPGTCRGGRARPDGVRLRRACGPPRAGTHERRILQRGRDARAVATADTGHPFGATGAAGSHRRMRRSRALPTFFRPSAGASSAGNRTATS